MATAVRTIERTEQTGGSRRLARGLAAATATLIDRVAAWSAPYYEQGTVPGELPVAQRLEAALRWHGRHGRAL